MPLDKRVSPLAPAEFPLLPAIDGVRLAAIAAGIRQHNRTDVMIALLAEGSAVAGCYTRSACPAAPIDWCRAAESAGHGSVRALIVNSGNANAFTGQRGTASVARIVTDAAALLRCATAEIFLASTGVIGEYFPDEKITAILPALISAAAADQWREAAQAIMTTDTFAKGATRTVEIGGVSVTINGIAKGSGMIAPDMATMLGFIFTDLNAPPPVLQSLLRTAVEQSFNAITVDGDTSTSDAALLIATRRAGHQAITDPDDAKLAQFRDGLRTVLIDLAQQIVRDGEGAEKFITIKITGASDRVAARRIGLAIGNSPLVKTAIAGNDANWGRIVMAVGKSGERADRDRLRIAIGGVVIAENGAPVANYDETPVAAHIKGREIEIAVDVGVGNGTATVWTCDLTHRYIDINGGYRS